MHSFLYFMFSKDKVTVLIAIHLKIVGEITRDTTDEIPLDKL